MRKISWLDIITQIKNFIHFHLKKDTGKILTSASLLIEKELFIYVLCTALGEYFDMAKIKSFNYELLR